MFICPPHSTLLEGKIFVAFCAIQSQCIIRDRSTLSVTREKAPTCLACCHFHLWPLLCPELAPPWPPDPLPAYSLSPSPGTRNPTLLSKTPKLYGVSSFLKGSNAQFVTIILLQQQYSPMVMRKFKKSLDSQLSQVRYVSLK